MIALTGYAQPEDRQHCLDAGFDHHVVKPLDFERLRTLIAASAELWYRFFRRRATSLATLAVWHGMP